MGTTDDGVLKEIYVQKWQSECRDRIAFIGGEGGEAETAEPKKKAETEKPAKSEGTGTGVARRQGSLQESKNQTCSQS